MTLIVELDIVGMVKRAWKEWQIVRYSVRIVLIRAAGVVGDSCRKCLKMIHGMFCKRCQS